MFDVAGDVRCREYVAQRRGYSESVQRRKGVRRFLSDGNNGSGHFDDRRLGLVGDQLAQEWDQYGKFHQ